LGILENPEFTETRIDLRWGDTFLLYTDGLFGSTKGARQRLTPEGLEKIVDHSAVSAEELLKGILDRAAPDGASDGLPDDVTALAVRRVA
jgi:serine phosphatase RsbU (regulator of sigma subunit)